MVQDGERQAQEPLLDGATRFMPSRAWARRQLRRLPGVRGRQPAGTYHRWGGAAGVTATTSAPLRVVAGGSSLPVTRQTCSSWPPGPRTGCPSAINACRQRGCAPSSPKRCPPSRPGRLSGRCPTSASRSGMAAISLRVGRRSRICRPNGEPSRRSVPLAASRTAQSPTLNCADPTRIGAGFGDSSIKRRWSR